eukprot:TRINITY_DN4295_c0_g3_i2.p2 TRINITY_DN4295_c0_g3~~TRINITY_DN4295_c0_g3_i2.p2  ORF type:complete len:314 (-),score=155.72 TRINITY_DN4295_c0_g3_i2:29-970(-)
MKIKKKSMGDLTMVGNVPNYPPPNPVPSFNTNFPVPFSNQVPPPLNTEKKGSNTNLKVRLNRGSYSNDGSGGSSENVNTPPLNPPPSRPIGTPPLIPPPQPPSIGNNGSNRSVSPTSFNTNNLNTNIPPPLSNIPPSFNTNLGNLPPPINTIPPPLSNIPPSFNTNLGNLPPPISNVPPPLNTDTNTNTNNNFVPPVSPQISHNPPPPQPFPQKQPIKIIKRISSVNNQLPLKISGDNIPQLNPPQNPPLTRLSGSNNDLLTSSTDFSQPPSSFEDLQNRLLFVENQLREERQEREKLEKRLSLLETLLNNTN